MKKIITVLLVLAFVPLVSFAQPPCVSIGTYTGADIFDCSSAVSGCSPAPCSHCRIFTIVNNCACTIDKVELDADFCYLSCGFLDDPTHPSWSPSRTSCAQAPMNETAIAGAGAGPGQQIAVRICGNQAGNVHIKVYCGATLVGELDVALP